MSNLSYLLQQKPDRFELTPDRATMKAIVTRGNGGYEQLEYTDVPKPRPRTAEVLIKVLAAGINNTEINTRLGWYSSSVTTSTENAAKSSRDKAIDDGGWNETTPFPLIQGTDCCGEVVAVGDQVKDDICGARVLVRACMRLNGFGSQENIWMASDFDGAFAQYVCVPASEVFVIDCNWSDAELATIPCAYATAENMVQRCAITSADTVLVTGASGGVGSALVQLVKRRGAQVIAVASGAKHAQLRSLGIDQLFDRDDDLLALQGAKSVSVIIDNVAGKNFGDLLKLLKRGGRYASSGAIAGPLVTMDMRDFYLKDLQLIGCTAWDEPVFPNLVRYIENSEIVPLLAASYALQDIVAAQQEFLKKQHIGNFVLIP